MGGRKAITLPKTGTLPSPDMRNSPAICETEFRLLTLLGARTSMRAPRKILSWSGLAVVLGAFFAFNTGYLLLCHLIESGSPNYVQGSNWKFVAIYSPGFLLLNLVCLSMVGAPRISLPKISVAALFLGALGVANFVAAMIVGAMWA